MSLLAYIGDKYHAWSDPSLLDPWSIINTTALYFLSRTAASAAHIYHEVSCGVDREISKQMLRITQYSAVHSLVDSRFIRASGGSLRAMVEFCCLCSLQYMVLCRWTVVPCGLTLRDFSLAVVSAYLLEALMVVFLS